MQTGIHSKIVEATVRTSKAWALSDMSGPIATDEQARNCIGFWRDTVAKEAAEDSDAHTQCSRAWLRANQAEYRILRLARMLDTAIQEHEAANAALSS